MAGGEGLAGADSNSSRKSTSRVAAGGASAAAVAASVVDSVNMPTALLATAVGV